MSEMINPTDHSTPAIYLINTMTRESKLSGVLEHFKIVQENGKPTLVEVDLKINGVPVDFAKSVTEMWERLNAHYDADVLKKAKELVSESRFEKLGDILRQAECNIQDELEALFHKKFD